MSIFNSTLDSQSLEDRLRQLLTEDASGHHRRWCERFLSRSRQGTSQDLHDAGRLIRQVLEATPSESRPALLNGPNREPAPKAPTVSQTQTVLACRLLELRILAAWVRGAPPTAGPLFQGALSLSTLIEGSSVWRAKTPHSWSAGDSIGIVLLASRLFYEGVYAEWRPDWKPAPLPHAEALSAANELRGVLERKFSLQGRLVVHTVGPFNSDLQECQVLGPVPALVMPISFGVHAGPPDEQERRASVREWTQEAVEQR